MRLRVAALLVLTLAGAGIARAQETLPTLAPAFAAAKPPASGIALLVGGEDVSLTEGATVPNPRADAGQIATAFGQATRRFGSVLTVAPRAMSVYNSQPGDADPLADLRPDAAFKRLSASLSPAQWAALTGSSGLGVSDLTSPEQRAFFNAIFPGDLTVIRETGENVLESRNLTDARGQIKLRLGLKPQFWLPVKDEPGSAMGMQEPSGERGWQMTESEAPSGNLYGVKVRDDVPNAPKRGQLNLDDARFAVGIQTNGVKTVGEFIARIGTATKTELYADANWEKKSVIILGAAKAAKASDLLRALAFCLTATYRQIGSAFVLTENILGRATLRQIWADWSRKVEAGRQNLTHDADAKLSARHAARDLTTLPGGVALTPEQTKRALASYNGNDGVTLDKLPPEQQQAVRKILAEYEKMRKDNPQMGAADIQGKIAVRATFVTQFTAPGLDSPVEMHNIDMDFGGLGSEEEEPTPEETAKRQAETDAAIAKPTPNLTLASVLESVPQRAVIAAPRTTKDLDALLVSMKSLGFNQLWLDVFSDGVAHLPGVPMSNLPLVSNAGPDILDEAIVKGHKMGIAVFASLDLLRWGKDADASVVDVSVLGEPSPIADARAREISLAEIGPNALADFMPPPADPRRFVSPFSPGVRENLTDLIHAVAVRPGLAGFVWRETTASGYALGDEHSDVQANALGYTEAARLAFLRRAHADPLDVVPGDGGLVDYSLIGTETSIDDRTMTLRWQAFRQNVNLSLLRALWKAVPPATPKRPRLPIIVRQRKSLAPRDFSDDWFASWDSPAAAPPAFRSFADNPDAGYQNSSTQARRSRQSFYLVPPSAPFTDAAAFAEQLRWRLSNGKWRGLVLDATGEKTDDNPLAKLAESAKSQTHPKGGANVGT